MESNKDRKLEEDKKGEDERKEEERIEGLQGFNVRCVPAIPPTKGKVSPKFAEGTLKDALGLEGVPKIQKDALVLEEQHLATTNNSKIFKGKWKNMDVIVKTLLGPSEAESLHKELSYY